MLALFLGMWCEVRFGGCVKYGATTPTLTSWGLVGAVMWFLSPENKAGRKPRLSILKAWRTLAQLDGALWMSAVKIRVWG
jgi:hypothetical protein